MYFGPATAANLKPAQFGASLRLSPPRTLGSSTGQDVKTTQRNEANWLSRLQARRDLDDLPFKGTNPTTSIHKPRTHTNCEW